MFRNHPTNEVIPGESAMTRSEFQFWSPPDSNVVDGDITNLQYFNADTALFQSPDIEYGDSLMKNINTEFVEPFDADDIIDSCITNGQDRQVRGAIATHVHHDESDEGTPGVYDNNELQIELPTDPAMILQSLSSMLDNAGGLKETDPAFIKIMESSTMMPMQCILINVLRSTCKNTLRRLMSEGAWSVLHRWLSEARTHINKPLMMEILQLYKLMPVSTKLLKSNSCAKDIKQLIKNSDERISRLARVIIDEWYTVVSGTSGAPPKPAASQKKQQTDQIDRCKAGMPQSEKAFKPASEAPAVAAATTKSATTSESKGGDDAKEKKLRPKTVKTLPSKFRSTGLEEMATDAQTNSKPQTKPVEKIATKKPVVNGVNLVSNVLSKPFTSQNHHGPKPSKVKIIPARPLQPELSERSAFLDALNTNTAAPIRRKRKLPSTSQPLKMATSPVSAAPELTKDEISEALKNATQNIPNVEQMETDATVKNATAIDNDEVPEKKAKVKKSVSWASDNDLCDYFYFDVDPDERVNVNKSNHSTSDFNDHRRHEIEMERKAIVGFSQSNKKGISLIEWRNPFPIEGLEQSSSQPGYESKEKFNQAEREARVLQIIYFSPDSVPDSPAEPDDESMTNQEEYRVIPLDDVEEEPMETETYPEQSITPPQPTTTLPPVLTNLLGNIMNQSPNVEVSNPYVSPKIDGSVDKYPHSYNPPQEDDCKYSPDQPLPDDQNFNHEPQRNDGLNARMQQFDHKDRYAYPGSDDLFNGPVNNFRPRCPPPGPSFHQNDFRGRNPGPRYGGYGGQLCQFFLAGNCRFGTNCRNLHPR